MLPSAPRHHGNGWKITLRDTLKNVLISIPTLSYYLEIFLYTEFSIYKASVFLWLVAGDVVVRSCRCWDSLLFTFSLLLFTFARPGQPTQRPRDTASSAPIFEAITRCYHGDRPITSKLMPNRSSATLLWKIIQMFLFVVEINHTTILSCIFGFCLQEFCFIPKSYQTCTFRNRNSRRIDLKFNRIVYQPTTLNTRKGTKVTRNWDVK